jgi:hypothetical protein
MTKNRMSPRNILVADRQAEALRLRRAGYTYEQIARELGYRSVNGPWSAIKAALARMVREPAEDLRRLELARLDRLMLAVWDKAIAGDGEAIDRCLRIMRRRSELLGLDAPKQVKADHSGRVTMLNWEDLVRAVPREELQDKISQKLERLRNGATTNGQP